MSKLKKYREQLNLTQEELSDNSGISVRTIQRIESGSKPQGHTLKKLALALGIQENELLENELSPISKDKTIVKLINISSLPFAIFPPANIIVPLLIMFVRRQFKPLVKEIISVQIVWLIFAATIFFLSALIQKSFSFGRIFMPIIMIILVLINVGIIIRNAKEIDKNGVLFYKLNFSLI